MAALSKVGRGSLGPGKEGGRRGKVEKGESQEVEGGEILGSKVCKGLLHVLVKNENSIL